MILCDTNILIEFFKDNTQIVLELRQIGQNRIGIRQKAKSSTITYNLAPLTGD
jgi:predicted nucleic acid-binding protein